MLSDQVAVKNRWGSSDFEPSPAELVASLPLRTEAADILRQVGLPIGPEKALLLYLRWENVQINHQPRHLRLLVDTNLERGPHFPKSGHQEIDAWADLTRFVVLGEVPNDFGAGRFFMTRYVCVDCVRGCVWWVYPKLFDEKTECHLFNTSLAGYLDCLLAYKEFREEWYNVLEADPATAEALSTDDYLSEAKRIHTSFRDRLKAADPVGFKDGFWETHAANEAILLGA